MKPKDFLSKVVLPACFLGAAAWGAYHYLGSRMNGLSADNAKALFDASQLEASAGNENVVTGVDHFKFLNLFLEALVGDANALRNACDVFGYDGESDKSKKADHMKKVLENVRDIFSGKESEKRIEESLKKNFKELVAEIQGKSEAVEMITPLTSVFFQIVLKNEGYNKAEYEGLKKLVDTEYTGALWGKIKLSDEDKKRMRVEEKGPVVKVKNADNMEVSFGEFLYVAVLRTSNIIPGKVVGSDYPNDVKKVMETYDKKIESLDKSLQEKKKDYAKKEDKVSSNGNEESLKKMKEDHEKDLKNLEEENNKKKETATKERDDELVKLFGITRSKHATHSEIRTNP